MRHHYQMIRRGLYLTVGILLFSSSLAPGALAAGPAAPQAAKPAVPGPINAVASGAVEDTLQACLARIPKDASGGQRMIAEHSCRRDDTDRKPYQATGGR